MCSNVEYRTHDNTFNEKLRVVNKYLFYPKSNKLQEFSLSFLSSPRERKQIR